MKLQPIIIASLVLFTFSCNQNQEKKESNKTIESESEELLDGEITVNSGLEVYKFKNGFPIEGTANKVYDNADLRRAIEAYKIFLPTLATEAVFQQMLEAGSVFNTTGIVMAQGPKQQFAATNSDTPYAFILFDLQKNGPMVVEMPSNQLLIGLANDHNMRWITDLGSIGVEKGLGGKHLFIPSDYKGEIPKGYYPAYSETNLVVVAIRTVPLDGDVKKAINAVYDIKAYPLNSPEMKEDFTFLDVSDQRLPLPLLEWEGKIDYWENLAKVINEDIFQKEYRYALGSLSELGIKKGQEFSPSNKQKSILSKAAKIAHAELSISSFANRRETTIEWNDRNWTTVPAGPFNPKSGDFGNDDYIDTDASAHYFFFGWGTSSAIGRRVPGGGSMYFYTTRENQDEFLDGTNNYMMTIPGPVPAKLFWSVTVYDAFTRCLIETDQNRAAVRSHLDQPVQNEDGSYTIYFGPNAAPEGNESNWVKTIPNHGFISMVRLYGPKAEVFDGSWRLSNIEKIK
jgi:hypothetical protein